MTKIYVCTEESILLDLIYEGLEVDEAELKLHSIVDELNDFSKAYNVGETHIMGELAAELLKEKYGVICNEEKLI
ncbi:hypothetical protein SAMN02745134_00351 [Clostridium acidisoli DSM 12555]|uniref:Uncharacterized protein n=1 Tax=Clostridium acidisoli DSM 12555 TaxID=1121291 RepID=A0A1W1X0K3_9CLOT|nr:hypothetical protein [Clostridium acidisoli]SMC17489.1 hypothetical protein SAMN02745134_00351 [Clostridium acidisoli DSM 12555]